VVAVTADSARRQDFSLAFRRTLLFEVGVFLACFLLVFLLPAAPREAAGRQAEAPAAL
jgi:hypothetical protein